LLSKYTAIDNMTATDIASHFPTTLPSSWNGSSETEPNTHNHSNSNNLQGCTKSNHHYHHGNKRPWYLLRDIMHAVADPDYHDVTCMAHHDIPVTACRFVLASRSKVLKCMLYPYGSGDHPMPPTHVLDWTMFSHTVVRAVIEYCTTDDVHHFRQHLTATRYDDNEVEVLCEWIQLHQAADFLGLVHLQHRCECTIRAHISQHPAMACLLFNQVPLESTLSHLAMTMIEVRPYVALQRPPLTCRTSPPSKQKSRNDGMTPWSGGGIECIHADRLEYLFQNNNIAASEYFLYQALERWVEEATWNNNGHDSTLVLQVATACAQHLRLDHMTPRFLLQTVQHAPFIPPTRIFAALARQALRAANHGSMNNADPHASGSYYYSYAGCHRGRDGTDRVLVEGAGTRHVNGVYTWIAGYAHGDLYSKREVTCGQSHVYTLSCHTTVQGVECRIFCIPVLTHQAIRTLYGHFMKSIPFTECVDPPFQPVLQVIAIQECQSVDTFVASLFPDTAPHIATPLVATSCKTAAATTRHPQYTLILSDGHYQIEAEPSAALSSMIQRGEVVEHSLLQVEHYHTYVASYPILPVRNDVSVMPMPEIGRLGLKVTQATVVHHNPGVRFGNPLPIDDDGPDWLQNPSVCNITSSSSGYMTLYACHLSHAQRHGGPLVPVDGWVVQDQGVGPPPHCWWIPAHANQPPSKDEEDMWKGSSPRSIATASTATSTTTDNETLLSLSYLASSSMMPSSTVLSEHTHTSSSSHPPPRSKSPSKRMTAV
jgi:hypothetical protein